MLNYSTTYENSIYTSTGVHSNIVDDPVNFPFEIVHAPGTTFDQIETLVKSYLTAQGRTIQNQTLETYNINMLPNGIVMKCWDNPAVARKIQVSELGVISSELVTLD